MDGKFESQKAFGIFKITTAFLEKMAKNSDTLQEKWFEEEIAKDHVIALCTEDKKGFITGKIINPPEVYDAGLI